MARQKLTDLQEWKLDLPEWPPLPEWKIDLGDWTLPSWDDEPKPNTQTHKQ